MPLDSPIASLVDTLVDVLVRELLSEAEETRRQALRDRGGYRKAYRARKSGSLPTLNEKRIDRLAKTMADPLELNNGNFIIS